MSRTDIAEMIAYRMNKKFDRDISAGDARVLIDFLCREIVKAVNDGRTVTVRGFGTFRPKQYSANTNHNVFSRHKTDENDTQRNPKVFVHPAFRAGKELREAVKDVRVLAFFDLLGDD